MEFPVGIDRNMRMNGRARKSPAVYSVMLQGTRIMIDFDNVRQFEVHALETSSREPKFLVGYKEKYFEVSAAVAEFITLLKECSSVEEVTARFSEKRGKPYSEAEVMGVVGKCIAPILKSEHSKPRRPLIFKAELIPAQKIGVLSGVLKYLFKPAVACILLAIIIALEALFFAGASHSFRIGQLDLYVILGVILLYISSSGFHELGHAAACKYYGVGHGGIGFGLYMNFPVFYTDVSGVWRLPRKQRVVVNMAGTYFQLIFLIPLLVIYLNTYSVVLKFFIYTVNLNFLITLNPFFKFDGYWIMSDLLGVPNLRQRTNELFSYWFKRLRGKAVLRKPFLLTMKKTEKMFMAVYSSVVNVFFGYYFFYIMPVFLYRFFQAFPSQASAAVLDFAAGKMPPFPLLQGILTQLLFLGFTIYAIYRMLVPSIKKYIRSRSRSGSVNADVTTR